MHDWSEFKERIKGWGRELGFDAIGIAGTDLDETEHELHDWLAAGCHGEMDYMSAHGSKRSRPAELVPGTRAVIMARMNYRPVSADNAPAAAGQNDLAQPDSLDAARRHFCTVADADRFYSYRRDGTTGRMASLIWLDDAPAV